MANDFYQFMRKKDGVVTLHQIARRFPNITKEAFLSGVGKWLDDKGMGHAEKLRALEAMEKWWTDQIEKYRNKKQWFKSQKFLNGRE